MRGKCLCAALALVLAAGPTMLGGDAKEPGEKVLLKLQGTWQFIAQQMDGKERPPEQLKNMTITFSGDKWTVRDGDKVLQGGTHKFDPAKKPAQVDAVVTEGEGKGATMLGIYELKGDNMKVCFDPQGKERPTSFTSKAGQFAAVVQREKKKS